MRFGEGAHDLAVGVDDPADADAVGGVNQHNMIGDARDERLAVGGKVVVGRGVHHGGRNRVRVGVAVVVEAG